MVIGDSEGIITMQYGTFEDLQVYKAAREYRKKIYSLARKLPEFEKYNLAGQMRRASLSLTNSIAEGHGRFHYQENIQYLRQSRGSLSELLDDINTCMDESYGEPGPLNTLKEERIRPYQVIEWLYQILTQLQTGSN
jgi:four helix bundle protein